MSIRFSRPFWMQTPAFCPLALWLLTANAAFGMNKSPDPKRQIIELNDAQNWADDLNARTDLKISVNGSVVRWLNHYLHSKTGRRFISDSLQRKTRVEKLIFGKIDQLNLPRELIAVPLVESGFIDLKKRKDQNSPVGIWQFDAKTARKYHLIVNSRIDERKQVPRSTDAALHLLKHLYGTFGNWQLALAAYNQGEGHVKKVLKRTSTRDAMSLANAGHLNEYVAKTTAAMLAIHQLKAI